MLLRTNQLGGLLYLNSVNVHFLLKKIIHIVFAAVILASSTGFTISAHYCHDQLIDLGLFAPAHSCCEKSDHGSCQPGDALSTKNHCRDESIVVESTDDYVGSTDTFNFGTTPTIDLLLTVSILVNHTGTDKPVQLKPPWHKEPPPFREVELSKIQTYLI